MPEVTELFLSDPKGSLYGLSSYKLVECLPTIARNYAMSYNFEELLVGEDFNGNVPATADQVAAAERVLGKSLPDDFRQFLYDTNGGEGFIGENYVMLWNTEELGQFNEAYQANIYAPGLVLFGSDGGGECYAFDTRTSPPPVVTVPFVGMSLKYAKSVAPTFVAFLEKLGG